MALHQLAAGLDVLQTPACALSRGCRRLSLSPLGQRRPQRMCRFSRVLMSASRISSGSDSSLSSHRSQVLQQCTVPTTGMAKGLGSFSGGATLQRSKLDRGQKVQQWQPKTDDGQGGGIGGKGIIFGGGGGDGDDGDDDDASFNEGEDGDGDGDGGFLKMLIAENYSRVAVSAVMQEWGYTIQTLPLIVQSAVQMGLVSSAQLARLCAMDNRPTVTRWVARCMPLQFSRGLVGRMMADPAFVQKVAVENAVTALSSLMYEADQRGDRFVKELDLVAVNTLCLMAASTAVVWGVAPNRSFGAPAMPWQRALQGLPSNVFDLCGPQRQYTLASRAASYAAQTGRMALVGAAVGAAMSALGKASTAVRQRLDSSYSPSLPAANVGRATVGLGAFMAVSSNFRYQLVAGMDRYLFGHSNFLWSYLIASGIVRSLSHGVSQESRLALMGLPTQSPPEEAAAVSPAAAAADALRRQRRRMAAAAAAAADGKQGSTAGGTGQRRKRRVKKANADRGFAMSAGNGPAYA